LSHKDFIKSLHDNDGRKWFIEERNGVSFYEEDTTAGEGNPYAAGRAGPAAIRKRKIREQLAKKVSKHERPYIWRLGYNHCVGQFSPHEHNPILSGSSLNRKKKPQEKKKTSNPGAIHYFSKRSRAKVRDKTTAFYRSIPKDRIFLTLTFIDQVDDQTGAKIFNKFRTVVKKECPGLEFIRIAEHQKETTGNIHFHVLLNKRLPVRRYNALWVLQQYNAGLRGHRADGSEISAQEIRQRYAEGSIQKVLNPLDVRKAYGIHGLSSYLTKYVTKQKDDDPFGCLTWHCSRRVSKLFTKEMVGPSTFAYLNSFANYQVDRRTGECLPARTYSHQFFTVVFVHNKGAPLVGLRRLEKVNRWVINNFEPDKLTSVTDDVYRKLFRHEKTKAVATAGAVPP
jgi:hypothetical protein